MSDPTSTSTAPASAPTSDPAAPPVATSTSSAGEPPPPEPPPQGDRTPEPPQGDRQGQGQGQGQPQTIPDGLKKPLPLEVHTGDDLWRYAQMLAASKLVPSDVRGSPASVMHLLLKGRELGLSIPASLEVHIIEGKASLPAQTIFGICKRHPVCKAFTLVQSTPTVAVYRAVRRDPTTGEITEDVTLDFTIEEAAYLIERHRTSRNPDKAAWITQPRAMLRWRCITALARQVFPDVISGLWGTEELVDTLEVGEGKIATVTVARAEVDGAKPAGGIAYAPAAVNLAGHLGDGIGDAMDATFTEVHQNRAAAQGSSEPPARQAEPVPAARPASTSGRLAEKAALARGSRGGERGDLFEPPVAGGPPGYTGPVCVVCKVPVERKGQRCDACANS